MAEDALDRERLIRIYRTRLEQWRRASEDQWNWGLISAMHGIDRVMKEKGFVKTTERVWNRWFTAAHLLFVCIRNVLLFARALGELLESEDIKRELRAFETRVPHAKDMRDFLEHFDEYARGGGKKRVKLPKPDELGSMVFDDETKELAYSFGGLEVELRPAFLAALDLSRRVLDLVPPAADSERGASGSRL